MHEYRPRFGTDTESLWQAIQRLYRVTRVLTRVLKSAGAVRFLNPHEVGYLERKDVHMFRRENGSYYNNISSQKVDASVTLDPSALGAHCSSDQCGDKNVVILSLGGMFSRLQGQAQNSRWLGWSGNGSVVGTPLKKWTLLLHNTYALPLKPHCSMSTAGGRAAL